MAGKKHGADLIAAAGCTALLIITVLLLLRAMTPKKESPVLFQSEHYTLRQGVGVPLERTLVVSKKEWMQGTLILASPLHPLPASSPLPNTRTVQAVICRCSPAPCCAGKPSTPCAKWKRSIR